MNVGALFDKLATDLAPEGVTERRGASGERLLVRDGVAFARLDAQERMAFRADRPAVAARAQDLPLAEGEGGWVVVPADDVAAWEGLARAALGR